MIPTFSNKIKTELVTDFLGTNLVIALINYEGLGLTDAPTIEQQVLRQEFSTQDLGVYEIGGQQLNGYRRNIVNITEADIVGNNVKRAIITVEFTAVDGDLDPFTHVVAIRGAKVTDAEVSNGNNRGNTQGTIIFVEPIENAPITVLENNAFEYTLTLVSSIGII